MTTTTKNGQISRPPRGIQNRKNDKRANSIKDKGYLRLNAILISIAIKSGCSGKREVARRLKIPTNGGKVTTKQMSGYIGVAKHELRKVEAVLKDAKL